MKSEYSDNTWVRTDFQILYLADQSTQPVIINIDIIIRPHRPYTMHRRDLLYTTDVARSVVWVSVCWAHGYKLCKKRLKRSRCRMKCELCEPKNHTILDGDPYTNMKGHF